MADSNPFSSDLGSVPGAGFAGKSYLQGSVPSDQGSVPGSGSMKPTSGPSDAYPNANDGYGPGDAMSDAVEGIQHSGSTPSGGNSPQTAGVVDRDLHSGGHVVGGPSAQGKTIVTTPDPNAGGKNPVASTDPALKADPSQHDPAVPQPGSTGHLSSGVAVRISDQRGS